MPVCQYDMQTYKLRGTVLACYDPICINLNQGKAQLSIIDSRLDLYKY